MIKKELQNVIYCDNCGKKQDYSITCDGCGKNYCFDCKQCYRDFPHGVHFSGSDLRICKDCLVSPPKGIQQELKAYQLIQSLRGEEAQFWESFKPRMEAAEKETQRIYHKLRGWK